MKINYYKIKRLTLFYLLSFLNKIFIKNKKRIFIEDIAGVKDNHFVMYEYLIKNNYNGKYEIIYFTMQDIKRFKQYNNVKVLNKTILGVYYKLTSKFVFYGYGANRFDCIISKKQTVFNLWHGSPLKNIGYLNEDKKIYKDEQCFTYLLVASKFFQDIMMKAFNCNESQIFIGGNPRNDLLFCKDNILEKINIRKEDYVKIICFLPTFRNSQKLSVGKFEADFPLLNNNNINKLDEFLTLNKMFLIIKLHHAQNSIDLIKGKYKNIKFLPDKEMQVLNINLYELLSESDILLTDYSSVYFDYLLLDRPIGFILEDIGEYGQKKGFTVKNPFEIMPGKKIYSYEDLFDFLNEILKEEDNFKEERKIINELVNEYKDPNNCKRILEFLGI